MLSFIDKYFSDIILFVFPVGFDFVTYVSYSVIDKVSPYAIFN